MDIDPCVNNYTPQVAFIDDGVVVPGTGGTQCITWCYGPGGYIVNNTGGLDGPDSHLDNLILSPVLAWPAGNEGAVLTFDAYAHEDLVASVTPGIFYAWYVRSATNPEDLATAPWRDRGLLYHGRGYRSASRAGHGSPRAGAHARADRPALRRSAGFRVRRHRRHTGAVLRQRRLQGLPVRGSGGHGARHRPRAGQLPRPRRHRPHEPRQQLGALRHGAQHRARRPPAQRPRRLARRQGRRGARRRGAGGVAADDGQDEGESAVQRRPPVAAELHPDRQHHRGLGRGRADRPSPTVTPSICPIPRSSSRAT